MTDVTVDHHLCLDRTSARPPSKDFNCPWASATNNGWTVDLVRRGIAITHLRITSPHRNAVTLTSRTPRLATIAGALSAMPVPHLEAVFDTSGPAHTAAWDAARRLHIIALGLNPTADRSSLRQALSWANLPYAEELSWKNAGVRSGLDALYYTRATLVPEQLRPYATAKAPPVFGWHRADLALYARHHLDEDTARTWAGYSLDHSTVALLLETGYTTTQAAALISACTHSTWAYPSEWARARVPGSIAALAVSAGYAATEATVLTVEDAEVLTLLAALRDGH